MTISSSLPPTLPEAKAHQQILMDWQGYIIESNDAIFSVDAHQPATSWSNFLESVFPILQKMTLGSAEIHFPRVNSVTNYLDGLFECTFMRVEWSDNDHVLVWNIFDHSDEYTQIQAIQQRANETRLQLEKLGIKN